jgi:hypothetical protein
MGKEENKINQREKKVIIEQNGNSSSNIKIIIRTSGETLNPFQLW